MIGKTKTAKKSSKTGKKPNPFYTPEAKAKRLAARVDLKNTFMRGIKENCELLERTHGHNEEWKPYVDEKGLKAAEILFSRLSLKELETLRDIFVLCEETGMVIQGAGPALEEEVA